MSEFVLTILVGILNIFGRIPDPSALLSDWNITQNWQAQGEHYVFEASSNEITKSCKANPEKFIIFPQVIHGVHEIYGDGNLVQSSGDITFDKASPFYNQTFISCQVVSQYSNLKWRVTAYSRFFSRILDPVIISSTSSKANFYNTTANSSAAGILLILAAFTGLIYYKRVSNSLTFSVASGSLFFSLYFLFSENSEFGITSSMLISHKIADIGLVLGTTMLLRAFVLDKLLPKKIYNIQFIFNSISIILILTGSNGDIIQMGTVLPMPVFLVCSLSILKTIINQSKKTGFKQDSVFKGVGILFFLIFGCNDILNVFAIISTYMLLPFGLVGAIFGLSLAVNREIENTYIERDSLLKNLDNKVKEKTAELQEALVSLKSTQSELVHSAKLASLGTLSAGIAHEINNSINYVNGALIPLERRIHAMIPPSERGLIDKLLNSIKEGTNLTIEIVKSLRTFTGLNQADFKKFQIKEAIDSVLTILKSKLRDVKLTVEIEPNLALSGNLVGINQVFMNLITNALDVLPEQNGEIKIGAISENSFIKLWVEDNGCGIPQEAVERIFDPFFTTKEVGKGTGLGLHIVQKEIEKHQGKISVNSQLNKGTKFEILIPMDIKIGFMKKEAS